MNREELEPLDPRIASAVDELQTLIRQRYPDAQFEVVRDRDDPTAIHLTTTVDTDEPDDVVDVVIDRLLELQVEERLPIHVIPLLPFERLVSQEESSLGTLQALLGSTPQA
jgi:hypothetical protein